MLFIGLLKFAILNRPVNSLHDSVTKDFGGLKSNTNKKVKVTSFE